MPDPIVRSAFFRRHRLGIGVVFYAVAAVADVGATLAGIEGSPELEGNPILRGTMEWLGPEAGLVAHKAAIGAVAIVIAVVGERAIQRRDPWIWRIPMTRWVRAWMQQRDRSWIAFLPLYAVAVGQVLAVASWLALDTLI